MKPLLIAACVAALAPLGTPAFAGGLTAEAVNAASPDAAAKDDRARLAKAQVLLDRARFSPGVIDGRDGDNFRGALAAFEAANGLKADGKLDAAAFAKLTEETSAPAIAPYTIRAEDVKGPFTPEIPDKIEKQAELPRLGYRNPVELIAERFHMDADLLLELNPDKTFDKAGEAIVVANVRADERRDDRKGKAAKIEVLKGDRRVRALAEDGTLLATYPASIGSDEKPAPSGTLKVVGVARNPDYTYDPEYKFKGVDRPLRGFLRHPRHPGAGQGRQDRLARLRAAHQLGRRGPRLHGAERDPGKLSRVTGTSAAATLRSASHSTISTTL